MVGHAESALVAFEEKRQVLRRGMEGQRLAHAVFQFL